MNKELERAFEWLEHRHKTMKELAEGDLKSEYMQGHVDGMKAAIKHYGSEIERIRQLIDGYLVEDVNLSGGVEDAS